MRLRRALVMVIASVVLLMMGLITLVWWRQERIAFQPPSPPFDDAGEKLRVAYAAADGTRLYAYVLGAPTEVGGLLLAFHGNADLAMWQIPWARELAARTGWRVMLAEYRGYGGNPGSPTYLNAQLDARAALDHAVDSLGVPLSSIVFYGHSLGSAVATELAAESPPQALILQSPFTSARDMARIIVAQPIALAWKVISRIHYDTENKVGKLDIPVHVAHGDRDLVVPVRMGRRVHAASKVKGQLLIVNGAGHNNVEQQGGDAYWGWLAAALASRVPET